MKEGRAKVLHHMGILPGRNTLFSSFLEIDNLRIKKAEKAILELTKEAKQKRRVLKRKKDERDAEKDTSHGAGQF